VRFPVTIRHRSSKAKIYAPAGKFAYYRLAYTVAGKRRMQTFAAYSDARQAGERLVRDLANASQAAGLSASQSRDALAAMQRLEAFRQSTGRGVSLLVAVTEYVEASARLNGRPLPEAIDGFLANIASVKRKDIAEAVGEFLQTQAPLAKGATVTGRKSPASTPTTAKFNCVGSRPPFPTPLFATWEGNTLTHSLAHFRTSPPKAATITTPPFDNSCNGP
jgi:hypothetical protein